MSEFEKRELTLEKLEQQETLTESELSELTERVMMAEFETCKEFT